MGSLITERTVLWAGVLMVVLPALILVAGEVYERLRQRDSGFASVVRILRNWVIPIFALWAVARGLFGLEETALVVRAAGTAMVLAGAAAALVVVRVIVERLKRLGDTPGRGRVPQLLLALPRVLVLIVAGWLLLDSVWGVDLTAAMTALGVTSLVVSFALQDTLSGLASGFLLLADSPFQPGDWIKVGDLEGRVVDVNWRSSRIVDRNGDLLVVPNAQLAGDVLVNYDSPERLHRVVVPVQVAFSNPPTTAKEMLLEAARSTDGVLSDPAPQARVVQIDDPLMGYEVHMWVDDYEIAPRVASDFGSLVWYSSQRRGVPLPSPAYDLYTYDGVQAGQAGLPDEDELRDRLRAAPLLHPLDEDTLDRLSAEAKTVRFAKGERFLRGEPGRDLEADRDLHVLFQGHAKMVLPTPDGEEFTIAELTAGDIFGRLGRSDRWPMSPEVVALEDCEIVLVPEATAAEVASRTPKLADALNQLEETRRRRLERIVDRLTGSMALGLNGGGLGGVLRGDGAAAAGDDPSDEARGDPRDEARVDPSDEAHGHTAGGPSDASSVDTGDEPGSGEA